MMLVLIRSRTDHESVGKIRITVWNKGRLKNRFKMKFLKNAMNFCSITMHEDGDKKRIKKKEVFISYLILIMKIFKR